MARGYLDARTVESQHITVTEYNFVRGESAWFLSFVKRHLEDIAVSTVRRTCGASRSPLTAAPSNFNGLRVFLQIALP